MVAGRRLEALLEQAIDAQLRRCMFHNNHRVAVSLLTDYVAGAEQIPTRTVQVRLCCVCQHVRRSGSGKGQQSPASALVSYVHR
jgi:hypothetical protein